MRIEVGFKTMLLACLSVGLCWALIHLFSVLLVVVVALVITGMLSPAITWLEGRRIKRGWAIAAVFSGLFVGTAAMLAITVPSLIKELSAFLERLPEVQTALANQLAKHKMTAPLAESVRGAGSGGLMAKAGQYLFDYSTRALVFVAYIVSSLFLALYLTVDRDRMRGLVYAIVPRNFHLRFSRILLKLEVIVGSYARGQLITSVLMAVFTFIVLTIARVPNALAIAAFAGVADVLPYIGGILACVPAVAAASSRGTPTTVVVLVALVVYQEIESRLIIPRVYGHALRLPPAIIMVAFMIGGTLMGIPGALLAPPIAAGIRMIIEELRVELPGEEAESFADKARDASAERNFEARAAGSPAEAAAAIATKIAAEQITAEAKDELHPHDGTDRPRVETPSLV